MKDITRTEEPTENVEESEKNETNVSKEAAMMQNKPEKTSHHKELAPNSINVKDTEEVSLRTQIQSDSEL